MTPDKPFTLGDDDDENNNNNNEKENKNTEEDEASEEKAPTKFDARAEETNTKVEGEQEEKNKKKKKKKKSKTTFDADDIMTFDDDNEDDSSNEGDADDDDFYDDDGDNSSDSSDDDDDDDLVAYDMDDEEDEEEERAQFESGERRPAYARECIARARESGDNVGAVEVALEQLRNILEDDPDDAEEYANDAMGLALDLHPPGNVGALRRDILILAAVRAPKKAARFLTRAFFDGKRNIGDRALILDAIVECAQRLSSIEHGKEVSIHTPGSAPGSDIKPLDYGLVGMDKGVKLASGELVEGKTRRWHKARPEAGKRTAQNKFLRVAGDFFYPLVQNGAKEGASSASTVGMLGEDGYVLGLLLEVLCVLLECSVGHVGHVRMCETLLRFAEGFKFHTDSSVRRGVYRCVWVVAGFGCNTTVLTESIAEALAGWRNALVATATEDPDPDCRALAYGAISRFKTIADASLRNSTIQYGDLN